MGSNFNETLINILKILMPTGTILILVRSCIDIIASTSVEFSIENNYKRALREVITFLKWLILFASLIASSILIWVSFTNANNSVDAITSGQFMMKKSEYLKLQKKEILVIVYSILFSLGIIILIIYIEVRKAWYLDYRKKTYFWDKGSKYFILKKIDKDYVLCVSPNNSYNKILSFDQLSEQKIYTETILERKKDRSINFYLNFKSFFDFKKNCVLASIVCILLLILVVLLVYLFTINLIVGIIFLIIGIIIIITLSSQFKFGKKQVQEQVHLQMYLEYLTKSNQEFPQTMLIYFSKTNAPS